MNDPTANVLGDGLLYEAALPLRWRVMDDATAAAEQVELHHGTLQFLRTLMAMGEHVAEPAEEEPGHRGQELARLDAKLNLVLDLLGRFLERHERLPDPVPVRLGTAGLAWTQSHEPPPEGTRLLVELYLEPDIPRPLDLPVKVMQVARAEAGGATVQAALEGANEALEDALQRYIFREHRRSIARQRHGTG
ncbi:MAG TPA: PilZ domain-containing protein [Gammaproteobacteria bacterium]|nr:PilZ domain-containing protein [Gammaproteobacteria bacterium]